MRGAKSCVRLWTDNIVSRSQVRFISISNQPCWRVNFYSNAVWSISPWMSSKSLKFVVWERVKEQLFAFAWHWNKFVELCSCRRRCILQGDPKKNETHEHVNKNFYIQAIATKHHTFYLNSMYDLHTKFH